MERNEDQREAGENSASCADAANEQMDVDQPINESNESLDESINSRNESMDEEKGDNNDNEVTESVGSEITNGAHVFNKSNNEKSNFEETTFNSSTKIDTNTENIGLLPSPNNAKDSLSSEDMLKNCTWEVGQLAWARMSIYPFWPCIVTYEPGPFKIFTKVQYIGRARTLVIHVHFFNDHGKHSWIPAHHMIPFRGIEDFRKRAGLVTDEIRRKEPKFAAALTIKPNIYWTWQKAVAEAMDVLYELDLTPLEDFKIQEKDTSKSVAKVNTVKRKRKSKEDDSKTVKKFPKTPDSNNEPKSSTNVNSAEVENNLNLDTPPVSPANEDDLRAAAFQKQKRITKMINKLQPPDFEVYYERNCFTIKEQHSDATDEQVREYLYDVWEKMAPEEKLKYRATYKIENN